MRTAFILTVALAAAVSLSACHKPGGNAASNATAGDGSSTSTASSGGGAAGDLTPGNTPHRKAGLWKIHMAGTGMPTMGDVSECVGPNTDKDMSTFAAKGMANKDCTQHFTRSLDGSIDGETTCSTHGVSTTMKTHITGDFGSHYHVHIESATTGPVSRSMTMDGDATWTGPCTPGPNT